MSKVKMQTRFGTVYVDGSFRSRNGKVHTKTEMKTIIGHYKGVNRIHKPMSLLFYTDVMNGKTSSWKYAEYPQPLQNSQSLRLQKEVNQ